ENPDIGLDPDDRRANYKIDRVEDIPAQSQKQQSAREAQLARPPGEMARELRQPTPDRGTSGTVRGERAGRLRGHALGTEFYWSDKENKVNNGDMGKNKAHFVDGTSNSVMITDSYAFTPPAMMPPPPPVVTSPQVAAVAASPDGRSVSS